MHRSIGISMVPRHGGEKLFAATCPNCGNPWRVGSGAHARLIWPLENVSNEVVRSHFVEVFVGAGRKLSHI